MPTVIRRTGQCTDATTGTYPDTQPAGRAQQAVNDGIGGVRLGKHPPVGFGFQPDAPPLEPTDSGGCIEVRKQRLQGLFTPRVMLHQLLVVEAGVGHVAAAPARYADFIEHRAVFLQDGNGGPRKGFGGCDSPEETGRSPTNNDNAQRRHAHLTGIGGW